MRNVFTVVLLILLSASVLFAEVDVTALKRAIVNANQVFKDSQASHAARLAAIKSLADFDHINSALILLDRLNTITKEVKYEWMICQPRYGEVLFELLALEEGFASFKDERIHAVLLKQMPRNDVAGLTLLQGLKGCPGETLGRHYLKMLQNTKQAKERIIAIESVGLRKQTEALPQLQKFAQDKKEMFGIRCTSIRSLALMPDKSSVEPLMNILDEKGRLAAEAHNALWTITGKKYGLKGQWQTWWKNDGEGFIPPPDPVSHVNAEIREQVDWERFYGIPVVGDRVMFVLDRSGSMKEANKIDGVKQEVKRIALKFTEQKAFNVMFFNHGTKLCYQKKPYVLLATDSNLHKLEAFLVSTSADGGTKTEEAMYEVLIKLLPEGNFETVFLLSDGMPNNDPNYVRFAIFHINRYLKVRIHAIYIQETQFGEILAAADARGATAGLLTADKFMQSIADMNDGMFRNLTAEQAVKGAAP